MIDFLMISTRSTKRGVIEIYPKFIIKKSSDLMIRGGDFYAIWLENIGLWSTDEQDALKLIDKELEDYANTNKDKFDANIKVLHMWDAESGMIDIWHKYCQKQLRDSFNTLDDKLIFSNTETTKKDFASKKLSYPLEKGSIDSYDKIIATLYSKEERDKIEWAIGSIVSGDSKSIQKFMVFYGAAGTGKSTILNIIQLLFDGYYSVFDAKALGSSSNTFALEAFKTNPLVAIQHDGDLSKIEDNTRLNSLVSHELMTVNEKFKSTYSNRFKSFLFMGTNKPVKITDAKSGLIRRLIDVSPSGERLSIREYNTLVNQVKFELGGIAFHCQKSYLSNPSRYDAYIPVDMLGASNDFYNFISDAYFTFKEEDSTTLKSAWEMYKSYCDDAKVTYPYSQRVFKEELRNYFDDFKERFYLDDGTRVRNYFIGFKSEKFSNPIPKDVSKKEWSTIALNATESIFDALCADCPAQYANISQNPSFKWSKVTTKMSDIDSKKLHWVKIPENHIVIDFDIKDEDGNKSLEKNLEAASKWPKTYSELSKSGCGVHLHYIYDGDVTLLSNVYAENIEIKSYSGNSSLRRKLTLCNDLPIITINSGLPLKKGDKKMINFERFKSEKGLRTLIKRNLNKEIHPGTKPSIDFINTILQEAYDDGLKYDVTDMRNSIFTFAASSSNQSDYCIKLINHMKFKSEDISKPVVDNMDDKIVFYDVEVFPNLFLVNWKLEGENQPIVRLINPTPSKIEDLLKYKLVGFNCRRYDNHILYARLMGYTNEQLYNLSQKIVSGVQGCLFGEAYNLSYTDVFDFSSKKQSLKKFEIELGIHHQELGLPWDKPVPENLWIKVAEYCDNDVIATEAVFNARKSDFLARQILADVAGLSVNDTTNTLTTRIIFGNNRKPQSSFNYRNMGDTSEHLLNLNVTETSHTYSKFTKKQQPIFPGYAFIKGKSIYMGEEVGEGGYVYSEPGIYTNVALLDVASMHPSSIIAEDLFGKEFTARFKEIVDARIAIKHKDYEKAKKMLNGALAKYLTDDSAASDLAQALKIAINSVYGLTSANFDNPFRDIRNKDNIVAKRGALFMINLKHFVQELGFTVAHIKTDSIKIPDATPEIIKVVYDYGKEYGYTFEHEATYEKLCLVNKSTYIAKYKGGKWTATGTEFQIPYIFKKLFSKEPIEFDDMCETKSVTGTIYLDMNEGLPDVSLYETIRECRLKQRDKLSRQKTALLNDYSYLSDEDLAKEIDKGHAYVFIGKVGQFCPIKDGHGGGILYREKDGKYYAVTGTKNYRWLESEMVQALKKEDSIDTFYYETLVDDAIKNISKFGDFAIFASDDIPPCEGVPIDNKNCVICEHYNTYENKCELGLEMSDLPF